MELTPPSLPSTKPKELSPGWRSISFVTWITVLAALIAVAISSRTIGRPVWWLGTRLNPAPPIFMLVPLSVIVIPLVATWRAPEIMIRTSIVCSILLTTTALPDVVDSPATALGIAVIGMAGFLSSIAQLLVARKYR